MALIGPRPIDTVGKRQKSGISHGCGYEEQARMLAQLVAEILEVFFAQPPFQKRAGVDARRGVALEVEQVARLIAVAARGRNG